MTENWIVLVLLTAVLLASGVALWWATGRWYTKGYVHGQEDGLPIQGQCNECGWRAESGTDIREAIKQVSAHVCPENDDI